MKGNYTEKKRSLSGFVRPVLAAVLVVLAMFTLAACEGEGPLTDLLPSATHSVQGESDATQPTGAPG